jgi:hypothetical protein
MCPKGNPANVKPTDLLHSLPINAENRKKWIELLCLKPMNKIDKVCSLHFEMEQFHSKTCLLLNNVYNQTNTCTSACLRIPRGVLPTR